MTEDELIERLKNCGNDPMWDNHAEVPKPVLKAAISLITRQKQALANCHQEIFNLRDQLLRSPQPETTN